MSDVTLKQIVEGLLMATEQPLRVEDLHKIIHVEEKPVEIKELRDVINEIVSDYNDRGLELKEVASGFRFQIRTDLSHWVNKLYAERPPKYSRALLETLALIAYRQPVTRAEIESVRGVTVSTSIMKTLLEHEWVRVVGYKEVPGKPAIFATTKKFLDHFNLKSLDELPPLMEFTETLLAENNPENANVSVNVNEIALASPTPLEVDESPTIQEEDVEKTDSNDDFVLEQI